MGQKVNPIGMRLGIVHTWKSSWYASSRDYADKLHQDLKIKKEIKVLLANAGVGDIRIERFDKKVKIIISAARPGVVIGAGGKDINKIKQKAEAITGSEVIINIVEVKKAEMEASIVANSFAQQLEKRVSFRKVAKRIMQSAMRVGAEGIKVKVSGRIAGAEIARSQGYSEGRVPLHTLRAIIDYGVAQAHTTYGVIGVKVWICKGQKEPEITNTINRG